MEGCRVYTRDGHFWCEDHDFSWPVGDDDGPLYDGFVCNPVLTPPAQTGPFRCPVCRGNGLVPNGFYTQTSGTWSTTSLGPEKCHSCSGKGVVWR